jgi:uncharacterized small protein (DUF1192 family)
VNGIAQIERTKSGASLAVDPEFRYAPSREMYREAEGTIMSNGNSLSLKELDERIAIVRDNVRQLIEQAAAFSGAEDEERNADRIAQQNEELEQLLKQRDALLKK